MCFLWDGVCVSCGTSEGGVWVGVGGSRLVLLFFGGWVVVIWVRGKAMLVSIALGGVGPGLCAGLFCFWCVGCGDLGGVWSVP